MPAKAGIHNYLKTLDFRLRGNDAKRRLKTFYGTINVRHSTFDIRNSTFVMLEFLIQLDQPFFCPAAGLNVET